MTREEAQRRAALSAERAKAQLAERERRASDLAPELWRSGKSVSEVAAEIGCSRATVQRRLRAAGVRCDQAERNRRITQRHGTRVKWSPDMVAALVRARQARRSYRECTEIVGVGLGLIKAKARELGLNGRNP